MGRNKPVCQVSLISMPADHMDRDDSDEWPD